MPRIEAILQLLFQFQHFVPVGGSWASSESVTAGPSKIPP
jgi:hypothetical protein